ncbi:CaiB/BaiF CoA-transferase family protein [Cognatishimia sp. F0-27]|uniref:CaiB/BaiF CoA transferase family protein n=1 Tax=Cognatishimia sp. F0-27 TaxID=2816855 RepID=UPI001D0C7597|nr:CaiB/BaiF CoA-transferase family protein [Cognatishimia sp. F0-27]MCC1492945.1 CoA transferase [Cognatishimia sp. F0-27]
MTKPLSGIRVLDVTNVLAGPFCCHQLAHMGAEVIKIETPERGDLARRLGADPALSEHAMGVSFLAQNAGKHSVTVNLKHPDGKALFRRLAKSADVLVENFRPGVMDRLGVGYETLKEDRPELVYCAITGFGQDGPWKDRPAYDQIVQGMSGAMETTGQPEGGPQRIGYPVADTVGGMTAAFAVAAALNARPRGGYIDVSMLESVLATMGWAVSNHLIAGVAPARMGNENPTSAPSGLFRTAAGDLNIAANKEEQWVALTDHLGLPHLRDDPDYATRENRKANRVALKKALETVLTTRAADDWEAELNALGIPAGAVLTVPQVLKAPQVAERGFLETFDSVPGVPGPVTVASTGIKLDGAPLHVATPPPALGADTDHVLRELGLSSQEVHALRKSGAI